MGGDKTPGNGVLAQWFEFFKDTTGASATGLQKFLVTTVVLVVLGVIVWAACGIPVGYLPIVPGAGLVVWGVLACKRCALSRATQPRQEAIGEVARDDRDEDADQEGDEVRDGTG